jgi:hypothetical protein
MQASDADHHLFCLPQVTFEPPARAPRAGSNKVARSGILLNPTLDPSNPVPQGEASGRHGAALLYDWSEGRLDMVGRWCDACLILLHTNSVSVE